MASLAPLIAVALVVLKQAHSVHKESWEKLVVFPLIPLVFFLVFGIVVSLYGGRKVARGIVFDRKQGMVWKEARRLEPVWQGGIRLRDISSIELAPVQKRAGVPQWELSLLSPRAGGLKASLVVSGNPDELRVHGAELARLLNVTFINRS